MSWGKLDNYDRQTVRRKIKAGRSSGGEIERQWGKGEIELRGRERERDRATEREIWRREG